MDMIKSAVSMQTRVVKVILERLFRKSSNTSKNLVVLDTNEFYAFVINNARNPKQDFKEVTAKISKQLELPIKPKTFEFNLNKIFICMIRALKMRSNILITHMKIILLDLQRA